MLIKVQKWTQIYSWYSGLLAN